MPRINSRRKGKKGEREFFKLLTLRLRFLIERELDPARRGGSDSRSLPGWSMEVKRTAKLHFPRYWRQACDQALKEGRRPLLAWRPNGRKIWSIWVAEHPSMSVTGKLTPKKLSLDEAIRLLRPYVPYRPPRRIGPGTDGGFIGVARPKGFKPRVA